jgi:hypothetical protein
VSSATAVGLPRPWSESTSVTDRNPYLDICQVDSPDALVKLLWDLVRERRRSIGRIVDYGAGDGRFCPDGEFQEYTGIEIDPARRPGIELPTGAAIYDGCAFDFDISNADLAVGNPPYVRNQDLPPGWRHKAATLLQKRAGVRLSNLANAYQYFFALSLVSVHASGLVALVLPYEWISRPSAAALRNYIKAAGWKVDVYRLRGSTFPDVMTDASITIVDRSEASGTWRFFEMEPAGARQLPSETASTLGSFPYTRANSPTAPRAKRGLSPGSQAVFVLQESQRARLGLEVGRDVAACVTTLRRVPYSLRVLDEAAFNKYYRDADARCWLIRTDQTPSPRLAAYLNSIPEELRLSSTCRTRARWWQFSTPEPPEILVSQSFKATPTPKAMDNRVGAVAVGGVAGVYGTGGQTTNLLALLHREDIVDRLVPYANELHKIEIGQLNSLLASLTSPSVNSALL